MSNTPQIRFAGFTDADGKVSEQANLPREQATQLVPQRPMDHVLNIGDLTPPQALGYVIEAPPKFVAGGKILFLCGTGHPVAFVRGGRNSRQNSFLIK